MIKYNVNQYNTSNSHDKIEVTCSFCGQIYTALKHNLAKDLKQNKTTRFCSRECLDLYRGYVPPQKVNCKHCKTTFVKKNKDIERSPNNFCSRSCAASYNNKHKTHGIRRSKLEIYLEEFLTTNYPHVKVLYNDKSTIGSELDFYFPELRFAIELNGIFHYEPIYGVDKFEKIVDNDKQKVAKCRELGIELAIIDSSKISYLTPKKKKEVSDIVVKLLKDVLNRV